MKRVFPVMLLLATFVIIGVWACTMWATAAEVVDPAEAAKDPDFAVQGEYAGDKLGAQVIALGDGAFDVVVYEGGLPGDGWKRGDQKAPLKGKREGEVTKLEGEGRSGQIAAGKMTLTTDGKTAELKRVERKSPTLGAEPGAGAVVLFDGTSDAKFEPAGHLTDMKTLLSGVTTKDKFGGYTLHLEFRTSWMPEARGQGRSNSGVYVHDCYEIQVLDSFGLEGKNNECGGFYSIKEPDVNMCLPPLQWQTYDIDFTPPKYENGQKVANARITVRHNGVVIHDNVELPKDTPGRQPEGPAPRPLHLQGHGNKVNYRNIWLKEK
jgi:hypothetical protein